MHWMISSNEATELVAPDELTAWLVRLSVYPMDWRFKTASWSQRPSAPDEQMVKHWLIQLLCLFYAERFWPWGLQHWMNRQCVGHCIGWIVSAIVRGGRQWLVAPDEPTPPKIMAVDSEFWCSQRICYTLVWAWLCNKPATRHSDDITSSTIYVHLEVLCFYGKTWTKGMESQRVQRSKWGVLFVFECKANSFPKVARIKVLLQIIPED
jgi:hypothetical protein